MRDVSTLNGTAVAGRPRFPLKLPDAQSSAVAQYTGGQEPRPLWRSFALAGAIATVFAFGGFQAASRIEADKRAEQEKAYSAEIERQRDEVSALATKLATALEKANSNPEPKPGGNINAVVGEKLSEARVSLGLTSREMAVGIVVIVLIGIGVLYSNPKIASYVIPVGLIIAMIAYGRWGI